MAKLNGNVPKGKLNSPKIANSWLELGIMPVPIRSGSKRPKGGKGWNTLRATRDTMHHFFEPGDNIGGLWGEPSGWIVDIDLDWDEAIPAASVLLPETFSYGRRSRPYSHYLVRCDGFKTTIFLASDKTKVVEIRSTGSQSVLPPSIHPDQERYEINLDVPFKTMSRVELTRRVGQVAAAAVIARGYPDSGSRHDYIHAVCGSLLWDGWKPDQVKVFMEAVIEAAGSKENDRQQRWRTIENTIEHFKRGDKVHGWKTLSQWLRGEDIKLLREWLKSEKFSEAPTIRIVNGKSESGTVAPPPHLLKVPGLVGEIAEWASLRSFAKQPLFDLAVGLMSVALVSGNRYVVDCWQTPLQPYFLLLAPTANGKDSALDSTQFISGKAGMRDHVFQGFQSYHAMLDSLAEPPHTAIWLWDEAARKMKSAAKASGGQDFQILTYLLSLYGKANTDVAGLPGRKNAITTIKNPFVSVLAAAQPSQMIEAITESDLSMGLINRFVLFDAGDELAETNFERQIIFPSKVEDALRQFRLVDPPKGDYPFRKIKFESTEVFAIFRDFNERCRQLAIKGGGWEMWGRSNQNALICAGIVAVGINPHQPIITERVAKWATQFLDWTSNRWVARVEECSSRSLIEVSSKWLERTIRQSYSFKHRAKGRAGELAALERGCMPKSLLVRLSRHLRGKDMEDAINQLVLADLVAYGEIDGTECYWIKK